MKKGEKLERSRLRWDTDVFIMALAFHKIGASSFRKCGTRTRKRILDIRNVCSVQDIRNVCRHAFTLILAGIL